MESSESDNQITIDDLYKLIDARQAETIIKHEGNIEENYPLYKCPQDKFLIHFYPTESSIEEVNKDPLKKVAVYYVDSIRNLDTLGTLSRFL